MILTDGNDNLNTGCLFSSCRQRSPDFVISGREGRSIHIKRQAIYIKGSLEWKQNIVFHRVQNKNEQK